MQVKFDYFNRPVDPKMFICNPNNTILAPIVRYSDSSGKNTLKITPTYNRTSELSIDIYKFIKGAFHHEPTDLDSVCQCYQYIENYRQIHVEGLGYFVITSTEEDDDGFDPYIEVKAISCETELSNQAFVLTSGTYQLWNALTPTNTIIGKILQLFSTWSVGSIASSVASVYRTFDDLSKSTYDFMMNDLVNAYSCICDFDIENRKINIIDQQQEVPSTDILLTYDNVINKIKVSTDAENIITALNVSGGSSILNSNLDITGVNPIGGNIIYNVSYYMKTSWMSQNLIDAINAWQTKINDHQTTFSNLVTELQTAEGEYATLDGQLSDLKAQLQALYQALSIAAINSSSDPSAYATAKANYDEKQIEVNNKQTEINNKQTTINGLVSQLTALQTSLSKESNFTQDQLTELSPFIHLQDFKDENIIITNSMSYADRQIQAQSLYNKAQLVLRQRCQPTQTFDITCQNFILMPEFDKFREQIELGKMIHVELTRGNIVNMALMQFSIEYNTKSLIIKVSNRLKLHDIIKEEQDWQNQVSSASSSISLNKNLWNYPTKSGNMQQLDEFRTSALNLTLNELVATTNQKAVMDLTGYHGFQQNNDGTYDPEQLWMTSKGIFFSTDGFQTIKSAFGKLKLPNGTYVYGLNADAILAGVINANLITTGKIQSANGKVFFDLDNDEAAVTKLMSSEVDTYARIGQEEPQYGTSSGLFLYNSKGKFSQMNQAGNLAGTTFTSKDGVDFISLGDISIVSNTGDDNSNSNYISLKRETTGEGEIKIVREKPGTNQEWVFHADENSLDIVKDFSTNLTNFGRMYIDGTKTVLERDFSDTNRNWITIMNGLIDFYINGLEVGYIDSGGWHGTA